MTYLCEGLELPALVPSSAMLLQRVQDDEVSLEALAELVQLDPTLTSKLLRVANSAFFGMGGRIAAIEEAILVLGLANTRGFVLTEVLMEHLKRPPWSQLPLREFWHQSLCMAAICHTLAHRTLVSPSLAFSVGLLHQMGVLVMWAQQGEAYHPVWQSHPRGLALAQAEQQQFHFDHAQAGAELLLQWNLPSNIADAVAAQYTACALSGANPLDELLRCAHDLYPVVMHQHTISIQHIHWLHVELFKLLPQQLEHTLGTMRNKFEHLKHMAESH